MGPVFAFAAETPDGIVLIDTGIGPPHPLIDKLYRPTRYPLDAALAACGLDIGDVEAIVNTHLHFDHCGGNAAFPGVLIYVQAVEHEAAHEPGHTIAEWVDFPGARYELLTGDAEIAPGVSVLSTPGHTPGHQSVLLDTPAGRIIVAGQAAETAEDFRRAQQSSPMPSDEQATASIRRILELAPTRVYFSHDPVWWQPKSL